MMVANNSLAVCYFSLLFHSDGYEKKKELCTDN